MALGALLALSAALGLPAGTTCSYDAATATVQAQMVSARTVVANAGDGRILVDGRVCGTLAQTRQIVVASAFPPAADTVVVDERDGRLADPATGRRPKLFALTGTGGDTMEVIGTSGRDRYVAHDDLGASIDLDADGEPDFVSTDVGRVVLRGMAGDDRLAAGAGPGDRMSHRAELFGGRGNDVLLGGRSGHDRLAGGPGLDTVRAGPGDAVTGSERSLPRRHP
jgi:Ca2+-binding RTX toxin-like protein